MSLIELTLNGTINKVDTAIKRIQTYNPLQFGQKDCYYVAYSGGKDSDVIRILCELAGVKYELVHHHTTVDYPETVQYIRSMPNIHVEYPHYKNQHVSMWSLIPIKKMPPTRIHRWCCSILKEHGGKDWFVMTGVRWAESSRRKKDRNGIEILAADRKQNIILNADNDESRRLFETCQRKGKKVVNPIIDWSDEDVWEFLKYYGCQSNPLYAQGYKRIGCVGCSMNSRQAFELEEHPEYKEAYIRAFQKMVEVNGYKETTRNWQDGEAVYRWWVNRSRVEKPMDGQLSLPI